MRNKHLICYGKLHCRPDVYCCPPCCHLQAQARCKLFPSQHFMCMNYIQAQDLRDAGKEPYAYSFERTHMAAALHEQFASLENGHEAELEV